MNSIGDIFRLTTFGESHGPAIGGIIDGYPAGIEIDMSRVERELQRRRCGDGNSSDGVTERREPDHVEWLSGIYEGKTLGTPIAFLTYNKDCRPEDYEALRDKCRPGHADYTYQEKYRHRDPRGGGRSSGRETVARVVAGALAKQLLKAQGITVTASTHNRYTRCIVEGLPAGVGEPVYDRMNARLAYAMLSIPSAMSFTMGETPDDWRLSREEFPDEWVLHGEKNHLTKTNHCGGVQGGISNGMPVVFHVGFHPPVTRPDGMCCRDNEGNIHNIATNGRHDIDHSPRLSVIVEAMTAITLIDLIYLWKKNR